MTVGLVAGVDEVGRGALAGPVMAAAVILDPEQPVTGLTDSKKLSEAQRLSLAADIRSKALDWALGRSEHYEVDAVNVLQASLLAMSRAVKALATHPRLVLVDGIHCPAVACEAKAIVKGDSAVPAISAASIVAKVARDLYMAGLDAKFPGYDFARHKGYPTQAHIRALKKLGVSEVHRKSFSPVARLLS